MKTDGAENPSAPEGPSNAEAQYLMRQTIDARKAGNMDATLRFALDAMRADPTATVVQQLYGVVIKDREKQMQRLRTTLGYLDQAVDAENAGKQDQAVALAEKAATIDPNPVIVNFIKDLKSKPTRTRAPAQQPPQTPASGGMPLWPIGAVVGLGLAGYGVMRSKSAWSQQDEEEHAPTEAAEERVRRNRYRLKVAAASAAVGFGIVYGGPRLWRAVGPTVAAAWRGAVAGKGTTNPEANLDAAERVTAAEPAAERVVQAAETEAPGTIPSSAAQGARLKEHLRQLKEYGEAGFKELGNGSIRYYGKLYPARTPGDMMGARRIREWNPTTGATRTWFETLDHAGAVRIVRPETGGDKVHYVFDAAGNYVEKR